MIPFIDLQAQRARIETEVNAAIQKVLAHGAYIMGPEVRQFEDDLQQFCGARHAITCSDGTDALSLALMALGIKAGDAVIVPSFTFASTAEIVALAGATPVFADSDARTFNIDPASAVAAIETAKAEGLSPKALIAVDLFGLPADYETLETIAGDHNLALICDSAQGFGGNYKGRTTGTIGDITTTSFFPAKPLGCYGDGGAVFTDRDDLAEILRSLKVHGKGSDKYDNIRIGLNSRLDTIQAAILIEKLKIYADEIGKRNAIARRYTESLQDIVETPYIPGGLVSVWAQYTLLLPKGCDRAAFMNGLKENGVPSVVYYPKPLHQQTAYRHFPCAKGGLPVCEDQSRRVVSLPMHPYMSDDDIDRVIAAVKDALADTAGVQRYKNTA